MKPLLHIQSLAVTAGKKQLIRNLSLSVGKGSLHILMGPNGSGKSTLAAAIMGSPHYTVRAKKLEFAGRDIGSSTPDERARAGIFLSFQTPPTISGVSLAALLPSAMSAGVQKKMSGRAKKTSGKKTDDRLFPTLASREATHQQETLTDLRERVAPTLSRLSLSEDILFRGLNEGFSGGEKKKAEMIQLVALAPRLAILDEPDSGLDVDALKQIATITADMQRAGTAILLITHYPRIVRYLKPDAVHILHRGQLVRSGGPELARLIDKKGFEAIIKDAAHATN